MIPKDFVPVTPVEYIFTVVYILVKHVTAFTHPLSLSLTLIFQLLSRRVYHWQRACAAAESLYRRRAVL